MVLAVGLKDLEVTLLDTVAVEVEHTGVGGSCLLGLLVLIPTLSTLLALGSFLLRVLDVPSKISFA